MAQISKYPIPSSVAERIFDVFIKSIVETRDRNEAKQLTDDLFTPVEKIMLAKRLAVAFLLLKGYQYREISRILRVSLGMIASVNEKVQYGSNGYIRVLEKVSKAEALEDFFNGILEGLFTIPSNSTKGAQPWRYLKSELEAERRKKEINVV